MARALEEEDGEIAPIWASVPAGGTPASIKEERGPLFTVESRDLLNFEREG